MRKRFFLPCLVVLCLISAESARAEMEYHASISAGQEYNSNVNESSTPKGDFVTVVRPQVQASFSGNRISFGGYYQGDIKLYDTGQRQNEILNNLEAKLTAQVVKDLLVVEVLDSNHMVFANATQGETRPADSTANQVNQNIATASAILTPRINERTKLMLGYTLTTTLYGGGSDTVNKYTQMTFLDLLHELTPTLEAGISLNAQRQNTTKGDLSRFVATATGRYTYGEGSYIFGRIGAVETVYDDGPPSLLPTWSAGLTHALGRTTLTLETTGGYVDNPSSIYNSFRSLYSATVSRDFERARLSANVSYSDYSGRGTSRTKDFTVSAQVDYELTERLKASATASRVFSNTSSGNSNRLYGTAELQYQLPKDFSMKLYYMAKINDSSDSGQSSYNANIVGLTLTKSF